MKKIVVFPGWGYPADFYNFLKLNFDEVKIVSGYKKVENKIKAEIVIAWSMGAINFLLNSEMVCANKIVLISPTFNFMDSVKSSYIKAMIRKIKTNKIELLKEFYKINFFNKSKYEEFLDEYLDKGTMIDDKELLNGLNFLMNTIIDKEIKINGEITVISGEKDSVIPFEKSKAVAEKLNCEFILMKETGHNIIFEKKEELIEIFRR
jgi:esterase/lipase